MEIFEKYAQTQNNICVLYVLCVFFQSSFDIQLNNLLEADEIGVVCRNAFNDADEWEESLWMHKLVNVRKGSVDWRKHQSSKVLWLLAFWALFKQRTFRWIFIILLLFLQNYPKANNKHFQAKQWHLHFQTLFLSLLL